MKTRVRDAASALEGESVDIRNMMVRKRGQERLEDYRSKKEWKKQI